MDLAAQGSYPCHVAAQGHEGRAPLVAAVPIVGAEAAFPLWERVEELVAATAQQLDPAGVAGCSAIPVLARAVPAAGAVGVVVVVVVVAVVEEELPTVLHPREFANLLPDQAFPMGLIVQLYARPIAVVVVVAEVVREACLYSIVSLVPLFVAMVAVAYYSLIPAAATTDVQAGEPIGEVVVLVERGAIEEDLPRGPFLGLLVPSEHPAHPLVREQVLGSTHLLLQLPAQRSTVKPSLLLRLYFPPT